MKVFVFDNLNQVSGNYHSNGGLMVIARNKDHVEQLIKEDECIAIEEKEWKDVLVYELMNKEEPKVLVFPDAGCC